MKASIGGTSFNASNCISVSSGTFVEIEGMGGTATAPTYPYVALWLNNYTKTTGTFTIDSTMLTNYAEVVYSLTSVKLAKSGTITITSTSPSIVGTFSFTATDGTAVTGGTFTAKSY
jgi:hypothetical protein